MSTKALISPLSSLVTINQHTALKYTQALVQRQSVTPNDAGCQQWIKEKLETLGFSVDILNDHGVSNLIAKYTPVKKRYCMAFAGHTDVVTAGDETKWSYSPFSGEIADGRLYGRGVADMKGGIAAFLSALERFCSQHCLMHTELLLLITSDEEGEAEFGTKSIMQHLNHYGHTIDYCLVGEPTSLKNLGDAMKVGRRGAISGEIVIEGKQGHVAYPQYALNAAHLSTNVAAALQAVEWDTGSEDFPGTSLQITYINTGDFTDNIIPGQCTLGFNVRFSHNYSLQQIKDKVNSVLSATHVQYQLKWQRLCEPYFTSDNKADSFVSKVEAAIHTVTGSFPVLSTSGGTSDGRFIASDKTQVVELGLKNNSIHQINEHADVADIVQLSEIYYQLLKQVEYRR